MNMFQDPEVLDQNYPPTLEHVEIISLDSKMFGAFFKAQGSGKKATIVLLHGFPGHERNFDIAHSLRRAGFNVMVFHYRGSWGSEGVFSFSNMLEDTRAAVDHLRVNSDELFVDSERIIPIGHSMGGWAALICASEDEGIPAAGSLAGFNLGLIPFMISLDGASKEIILKTFSELIRPMDSLTPQELLEEVLDAGESWNILGRTSKLLEKKILIVGAKKDQLSMPQYHYDPLVEKFHTEGSDLFENHLLDCDHNFSSCRLELTGHVSSWMQKITIK